MRSDPAELPFARCNHDGQVTCSQCRLSHLCLPLSLEMDQIGLINEAIERDRTFHKGDYLYHAGEPFGSIYAVRAGCIKSVHITGEGQEQIVGFYLPGEILGMEGVDTEVYSNSAIALGTSAVCQIPFHRLEQLGRTIPSLQHHYFQLMSREINNEQKLITLLSKGSSEQRITSLLLSLSQRHQRRQLSATEFMLPMSRTDISNNLGLTIETVSRVFSRLRKQGLIKTERRMITLLDINKLKHLANGQGRT